MLGKVYGEYVGQCKTLVDEGSEPCKGFLYNEGPCAHLCTLRKAEFIGPVEVNGIRIEEAPESRQALVADCGREAVENVAAGADGRVFGRPEGRE